MGSVLRCYSRKLGSSGSESSGASFLTELRFWADWEAMRLPISSSIGAEDDDPAATLVLRGVTNVLGGMGSLAAASGSKAAAEE